MHGKQNKGGRSPLPKNWKFGSDRQTTKGTETEVMRAKDAQIARLEANITALAANNAQQTLLAAATMKHYDLALAICKKSVELAAWSRGVGGTSMMRRQDREQHVEREREISALKAEFRETGEKMVKAGEELDEVRARWDRIRIYDNSPS